MSSHTPGPWTVGTDTRNFVICALRCSEGRSPWTFVLPPPVINGSWQYFPEDAERLANAHLIAAAPDLLAALLAEDKADEAFDAADEYTHRAEAEDWLNDPTGSMHVTEAWDRARKLRADAKELRRAALSSLSGYSVPSSSVNVALRLKYSSLSIK